MATHLSELQALRHVADLGHQKKLKEQTTRQTTSICKEVASPLDFPERLGGYAMPLSALRERDHTALADWFQNHNMVDIEADMAQMLLRLMPEPPWEDDPFEFLREFL